jgi:DNA-binding transcriptional regulator of glucitol operon
MDQNNKKLLKQVLIFIVVFAIAFLGTKYVMSSFNSKESTVKDQKK